MSKLSEIIEESEKEFDEEFPSPDGQDFIGNERISKLKSFLHAHSLKMIAGFEELCESKKLLEADDMTKYPRAGGYNLALQDLLADLKILTIKKS